MGRVKSPEQLRKRLRKSIDKRELIVAPGIFDAVSAMLVEQSGFPAAYISGFATEGAFLGRPDMGFLTKDLMITNASQIAKAVDIPVLCDMEQGYGSAVHLQDHLREFEATGLAGVHLDDMVPPPKCPHVPDIPPVRVVSIEEMTGKIRRAVEARRDPNFLIIARCNIFNAFSGSSKNAGVPKEIYAEYVERLKAYTDAGADMAFIRANTKEEVKELSQLLSKPILGNINPWRQITLSEFKEAGTSVVITSMPFLFVAVKALKDALDKFKNTGNLGSITDMMVPAEDYWALMRVDEYRDIFDKYDIS